MPATLHVYLDNQCIPLKIPDEVLTQGSEMFNKMDADMDKGWQMSRTWVECPNVEQRCQIAADRILGAIETENQKMATMMAGYILHKVPSVKAVAVATNGEMQETELMDELDPFMPAPEG